MQSIGVVFKKDEMIMVCLKQGITELYLEGYRILPFLDFKEEEKEEAILHNLERFLKSYRGGRDNLFIGLPRDAALVQFLYLPVAVEENLHASLGYEIDKHTPFTYDDVYFDCHVLQRMPDNNLLQVLLITVKKEIVDYYLNLFKKLNVKPRGVELTTTALLNMVPRTPAGQEPAAHSPAAPHRFAGKALSRLYDQTLAPHITRLFNPAAQQTVAAGVDILFEQLEKNRCELAVLDAGRLCCSQIVTLDAQTPADPFPLEELYAKALQALIDLPYHQHREQHRVRLILSGREFEKDRLERAAESIGQQVVVLQDLPVKTAQQPGDAALPVLAVPVGLALKGLKSLPLDVNFIPPPLRPKKKRSKRKMIAAACTALLVLGCLGYFVKTAFVMKTRLLILNEEVSELKKQVQIIEAFQEEALKMEQVVAAIKTIREGDVGKLKQLEELTRIIPDDSYLTEFQYKGEEKKVKLSGFAVSASKLIPLLEESPMFDNVKFTSPITTDKRTSKERFRLEMNLSSGAK